MTLYHGTSSKYASKIAKSGLRPSNCKKMAYVDQSQHNTLQGKAIKGVYGWTNLNDAILFSRDNYSTDAVVFEFETDEQIIDDPEFVNCDWIDGQAKFVVTSQAIKATKVWSNLD